MKQEILDSTQRWFEREVAGCVVSRPRLGRRGQRPRGGLALFTKRMLAVFLAAVALDAVLTASSGDWGVLFMPHVAGAVLGTIALVLLLIDTFDYARRHARS